MSPGRENCPPGNIGRVFGSMDSSTLEGSLLSPNYCIVKYGVCEKHMTKEQVTTIQDLSHREQELVRALAAGATRHKELATAIGCADATIDSHLSAIYRKVGVQDKVSLLLALYELKEKEKTKETK